MPHAMTLEELQARLAKDLGSKYKGPKRKVTASLKNFQKAIAKDLKEIEAEEKETHKDDFLESDFDLDDIDSIDQLKEEDNGFTRRKPQRKNS